MDNLGSPGAGCLQPNAGGVSNGELRCELLCFVQKRSEVLTTDDMVNVCSNFYSASEVESARLLLKGYVPEKRLPKHKGGADKDKIRKTMLDIIKVCLDPGADLPTFYALDIARLPPVGVDHVDMCAILQELTLLRQEVRMISELRKELDVLRSTMSASVNSQSELDSPVNHPSSGCNVSLDLTDLRLEVQTLSRLCDECVGLKQEVACMKRQIEVSLPGAAADWPPLQDAANVRESATVTNQLHTDTSSDGTSFAGHVKALRNSGATMKRGPQPIVGTSSKYPQKSVITRRSVDVFVSRWDPHTKSTEVVECVNDILQGKFSESTVCTQLKPKYEHLYASFYVSVTVPASCMKNVIDCLMSPESWPSGLLIKRYFHPKKKDG